MKKKVLSILMGVSILAAALAGCGKAPASTENSAPAPAATDSAQAAETPEAPPVHRLREKRKPYNSGTACPVQTGI